MKQTLEKVIKFKKDSTTEKYRTTVRFITYQGYKFFINSRMQHAIDMKKVNELKQSMYDKATFKTDHLEKMMKCLVDARNVLSNPILTHITLHLNDGYVVSDITERLKRIAVDPIRYLWSLEDKDGNVHIHLYLVVDVPDSVLNIDEHINENYNKKLVCSALKEIYNTQHEEKEPYFNLKKDNEFMEAVHYASYATKQTCKSNLKKGVRSFGTSKIEDKNQLLKLEDFYAVHEYFEEIILIGQHMETFRLGLTVEKAGSHTHLYWSVRDFNLHPDTTIESLVNMLDHALACSLPDFIKRHRLYLQPDENILEFVEVLPVLNQYKQKQANEVTETIIKRGAEYIPLVSNFEDELLELVTLHLENCLIVKDQC